MTKAILLAVGASIKRNRGLSPLFPDKTFEYIPWKLEDKININRPHNHRHYSMLKCQNKNLTDMHMSSFVQDTTAHVDPEFYSFTYGESNKTRIKQLKTLDNGSFLIFGSYLQQYTLKNDAFILKSNPAFYVIGYFEMTEVHFNIKEIKGPITEDNISGFSSLCNEHIIYKDLHLKSNEDQSTLLIKGNPNTSVLFKHPLKIGFEDNLMKKYIDSWGIKSPTLQSGFSMCEKVGKVIRDLQNFSQENKWIEWMIP